MVDQRIQQCPRADLFPWAEGAGWAGGILRLRNPSSDVRIRHQFPLTGEENNIEEERRRRGRERRRREKGGEMRRGRERWREEERCVFCLRAVGAPLYANKENEEPMSTTIPAGMAAV